MSVLHGRRAELASWRADAVHVWIFSGVASCSDATDVMCAKIKLWHWGRNSSVKKQPTLLKVAQGNMERLHRYTLFCLEGACVQFIDSDHLKTKQMQRLDRCASQTTDNNVAHVFLEHLHQAGDILSCIEQNSQHQTKAKWFTTSRLHPASGSHDDFNDMRFRIRHSCMNVN